MTTPIKYGTRWRHRIMVNGKRVSGTFDTKAAALKWEAHQRVLLGAGALATTTENCADAFRRYELEVSKQKRGYKWEAGRLAAMASSPLWKVLMAEVNPSHIAAWRDQRLRQVQGGTVTREMNLLSHVFWHPRCARQIPKQQPPRPHHAARRRSAQIRRRPPQGQSDRNPYLTNGAHVAAAEYDALWVRAVKMSPAQWLRGAALSGRLYAASCRASAPKLCGRFAQNEAVY